MIRYITVFLSCCVFILSGCQSPVTETQPVYTQTIYLVRHAEKQTGDDPQLTEAGQARAMALMDKLKDKSVDYIYSSDTRRTIATARPLADHLNTDITFYDARDLESLAIELAAAPGVYLVVGHSNTTPQLASLLAGGDIAYMPETEYDRFIEINLGDNGNAVRATSRFGARP